MNALRRTWQTVNGGAGESGQSIIMVALSTFFLLAILAIVAESSLIYIQRRDLQNAADAAALAGAQRLPEDPALAVSDAKAWAAKNVSGLMLNEAEVFDGDLAIRSTVKKRAETMFSGRFSFGRPEITARAAAKVRAPQLLGPGVVPLAISDDTPRTGQVTLKEFAGNNSEPRSSYQLLDLPGGNGANDVCNFLIGGSLEPITDPVDAKPGNVSSLHNCLITRMNAAAANNCRDMAQVAPAGLLIDRCNPLGAAGRNAAGVQPTAVVVVPVVTNFCNGACDLDIVGDGADLRQFAYFLIDRSTVEPIGGGPTCAPPGNGGGGGGRGGGGGGGGNGTGQCWGSPGVSSGLRPCRYRRAACPSRITGQARW